METNNFDVVVDLSMDPNKNKEVLDAAKADEQAFRSMEAAAKQAGKTIQQVMDQNAQHLKTYSTNAVNEGNKVEKSFDEQAKAAAKAATAQAQVWSQEARILNTRGRQLQLQSRDLVKYADAVGIVSRSLLIGGTAITGGIFKLASDFVKDAPHATRLTLQWKAAQDSLNESQSRAGKVAAQAALPVLEEVARLAAKAADFMEKNPNLVRAALNVGIVTAGLGMIGVLVSKGIKLQADLLFIQSVPIMQEAALINEAAANQMLLAAQLNAEAKGIEVVTAGEAGIVGAGARGAVSGAGALGGLLGGIASAVSTGLQVALPAIIAATLTDKVFDKIQGQNVEAKDYIVEAKQILALAAGGAGLVTKTIAGAIPGGRDLSNLDTEWFKRVAEGLGLLTDKSNDAGDALDKLAGQVESSPAFEKILDVYEKYQAADLKLVTDHYNEREKIIEGALQDEIDANRKYASDVSKVGANTSKALADLQKKYDAELIKAETKHNEERSKILESATDDIKKIEEDLQETLRKNQKEHQERLEDILGARDALALVKENRRFDDQQAEERRQANLEIRRMRQDLAKRLTELDAEYAQERLQRQQEFAQRAIEIKQQAAERLAELQAQHQEELRRIKEQAAQKLREADAQFIAERKRRYEYFVAQIRDLDAELLGQRNIKMKYYNQELNDLNAWVVKMRAGTASLYDLVPPHKASGGYTVGTIQTGEEGYEWIATHKSTTAAESIIGGRLTQDVFMQAMRALQATRSGGTYIDQRRLEVPMNKESKQAYEEGARQALSKVLGLR